MFLVDCMVMESEVEMLLTSQKSLCKFYHIKQLGDHKLQITLALSLQLTDDALTGLAVGTFGLPFVFTFYWWTCEVSRE